MHLLTNYTIKAHDSYYKVLYGALFILGIHRNRPNLSHGFLELKLHLMISEFV